MKQPNPFKSYLIALLLLSPFIAQANPVIPNPTAPNPIAPQPTAPKPTTPITTHPTTIPYSIAPLLPYIPQIGPDGRLVIPTAPLLPRYPTHYQDFFKKHKAYEYGAGLSLQEIGRIAQSKGYTLYSNRAFNEIASVLSPAPLWPEWVEKIREVQKKDVGSIDTAGQLTTYYVQSKGDYLGYAYFGVIDKNNREGKQQTAFDAILPEINKRNFFADTIDKQNLTPEQREKAWRTWNKQQEAAMPRKPTEENLRSQQEWIDYQENKEKYIRDSAINNGINRMSAIAGIGMSEMRQDTQRQPLSPYPLQPLPFEDFISKHPDGIRRYVDTVDAIETTWDVVSLAAGVPPVRKLGKELLKEGAEQIAKQGMKHLDDMAESALKQAAKRGDDVVKQGAKRVDDAVEDTIENTAKKSNKNPLPSNGAQAKKMHENAIADLIGEEDWHKSKFKNNIFKRYRRELRGSNNFDLFFDRKTNEYFIQGNKSSNRIKIVIEEFL